MISPKSPLLFLVLSGLLVSLLSCNKEFDANNYVAYFGGEVSNPTSRFVLFCKDSEIIDTIPLKKDNTFFIKFDSLTPGLYSFKHNPEYQYVYFDKNDSLMVQINSKEFDESIVFCGRGDEKNNFLMELYLKNEADKQKMFDVFDYNLPHFISTIDSSYQSNFTFYSTKKNLIKWSKNFDHYAKATLNFHYYSKKELYPTLHKIRTGTDIFPQMPKDFYKYRKKVDFNDVSLLSYTPYLNYITHMLNNVGAITYHHHLSDVDIALKVNVNKLHIADTLISNSEVKNRIFNGIAFTYLLEDQNMVNNHKFFETYNRLSTDKSQKNEIVEIGKSIQLLAVGKSLPAVNLTDVNGNQISSTSLLKPKTVLFFWTENASSHLAAAHRKVIDLMKKHPEYQFIAINLDREQSKWKEVLSAYKFGGIKEFRGTNFEELRKIWVINKIHRTIVLDENGAIKNAFANLFDINFDKNLE